jgi:hypothetical protein
MPERKAITRLADLEADIRSYARAVKALSAQRFFGTSHGRYGEGDLFIGVTVPEQRTIAKKYRDLPPRQALALLKSPIHEERLVALIILVLQFQSATRRGDEASRKQVYDLYMANLARVDNWDLVDASASYIVGAFLADKRKDVLLALSRSDVVWERRIAMVATHEFIRRGDASWALKVAAMLMNDKHDLSSRKPLAGCCERSASAVTSGCSPTSLTSTRPRWPAPRCATQSSAFPRSSAAHTCS